MKLRKINIYTLLIGLLALSGTMQLRAQRDTLRNEVVFKKPDVNDPSLFEIAVKGKVYPAMITEEGDTLIIANLDDVSITSARAFADPAEQNKYNKMRAYAIKVFPYAKEAIRIFREVEYASEHLSRREKKRKLKELETELKQEFEQPLKKLTKLQGKIMLKMIEKETGRTTYDLVKELKGGFRAFYWYQFSKLYSYDLKEGYNPGQYRILDIVLSDFDLGYRIDNNTNLKYIKIEDLRK